MKKAFIISMILLAGIYSNAQNPADSSGKEQQYPSYAPNFETAAQEYEGEKFQLSQNYPKKAPKADNRRVGNIDFTRKPEKFAEALWEYFWEGQEASGFIGQKNKARTWYHAPWLHSGTFGREFVHGLVPDRITKPGELTVDHEEYARNYSLTLYNPVAAHTIGKAWQNPDSLGTAKIAFDQGAVIVKLVFTTAEKVDYLENALSWEAYIDTPAVPAPGGKLLGNVRLIQVDIAARTNNSKASGGWVFASYIYNGRSGEKKLGSRFLPIGLQWGNDPKVEEGKALSQTWINKKVWNSDKPEEAFYPTLGKNNRLVGPVDNRATSIYSRHMTAGWPLVSMFPPKDAADSVKALWFRNLERGEGFNESQNSFDFSIELAQGYYNYLDYKGNTPEQPYYIGEMEDYVAITTVPEVAEETEEEFVKPGLTGTNLLKFIFFSVLILLLLFLLIRNIIATRK